MHRHLLLGIIALAASAVNAEGQKAGSERKCTPAVIDTVQFGSAPIFRDCDVEKPAKLKHEERPNFRLAEGVGCARVEMLFVVDSSGKVVTSSATLVSTNEPDYAASVLASLPKWRYEPARRDRVPVAQLTLVRHARSDGTSAERKKVPFSTGPIRAGDRIVSTPPTAPSKCE